MTDLPSFVDKNESYNDFAEIVVAVFKNQTRNVVNEKKSSFG